MSTVVNLADFKGSASEGGDNFEPLGHEDVCYSERPWRGEPEDTGSNFSAAANPLKAKTQQVSEIVADDRPSPTEWR